MTYEAICGDMRIAVPMLEPGFDACVTDCPYELNFMSRAWDRSGVSFQTGTWRAVYEALKPGAHLLAFGGTRTVHRIACAIEDAGFEIRDQIQWLYGSGFPKSLDVSKAIDRAAGAERELTGEVKTRHGGGARSDKVQQLNPDWKETPVTAPATPEAQQWQGWGTALKPACEPIVVARKPLSEFTVAANILTHGTGAINVDACRIEAAPGDYSHPGNEGIEDRRSVYGKFENGNQSKPHVAGRWPANVILGCACEVEHEEGCAVRMLDEQSGILKSGRLQTHHKRGGKAPIGTFEIRDRTGEPCDFGGDSGGASRFYYCAKANAEERRGGSHPTVKPVSLMRYLVRLVTPKGGRVLDPFAGTFKTGEACIFEDFDFTGIDLEEANCETGRLRLARASGKPVDLPRPIRRQIETPLFGGAA